MHRVEARERQVVQNILTIDTAERGKGESATAVFFRRILEEASNLPEQDRPVFMERLREFADGPPVSKFNPLGSIDGLADVYSRRAVGCALEATQIALKEGKVGLRERIRQDSSLWKRVTGAELAWMALDNATGGGSVRVTLGKNGRFQVEAMEPSIDLLGRVARSPLARVFMAFAAVVPALDVEKVLAQFADGLRVDSEQARHTMVLGATEVPPSLNSIDKGFVKAPVIDVTQTPPPTLETKPSEASASEALVAFEESLHSVGIQLPEGMNLVELQGNPRWVDFTEWFNFWVDSGVLAETAVGSTAVPGVGVIFEAEDGSFAIHLFKGQSTYSKDSDAWGFCPKISLECSVQPDLGRASTDAKYEIDSRPLFLTPKGAGHLGATIDRQDIGGIHYYVAVENGKVVAYVDSTMTWVDGAPPAPATETPVPTEPVDEWAAVTCQPPSETALTRDCLQAPNPLTDPEEFVAWEAQYLGELEARMDSARTTSGLSADYIGSNVVYRLVPSQDTFPVGLYWFKPGDDGRLVAVIIYARDDGQFMRFLTDGGDFSSNVDLTRVLGLVVSGKIASITNPLDVGHLEDQTGLDYSWVTKLREIGLEYGLFFPRP